MYLALQQKWLPLLSGVCRFVHEQLVKLESGVGKEEAAKEAFWAVRNSGVDIRLKEVCPPSTSTACVYGSLGHSIP